MQIFPYVLEHVFPQLAETHLQKKSRPLVKVAKSNEKVFLFYPDKVR